MSLTVKNSVRVDLMAACRQSARIADEEGMRGTAARMRDLAGDIERADRVSLLLIDKREEETK